MLRNDLISAIEEAIQRAQAAGSLPDFEVPPIPVEHPRREFKGDYATPVCMQLARPARMAPYDIAQAVVQHFPRVEIEANLPDPAFGITGDLSLEAPRKGKSLSFLRTPGRSDQAGPFLATGVFPIQTGRRSHVHMAGL